MCACLHLPLTRRLLCCLLSIPLSFLQYTVFAILASILLIYGFMFWILERLASSERSTYHAIDDSIQTTIAGNLRRRGSISQTPELEIVGDYMGQAVDSALGVGAGASVSPVIQLSPSVVGGTEFSSPGRRKTH